jgi:methionyl-tRNA synthetase
MTLVRSPNRDAGHGNPSPQHVGSDDIAGLPVELRYHCLGQGSLVDLANRDNHEILFVLAGSALLSGSDGTKRDLTPGVAVLLAENVGHSLAVGSGTDLEYVSLTWSDGHALAHPDGLVRSFDRDTMVWAYEMYLQDLYDAQLIPGLPFGSVFGSVPPGATSKAHCHQDDEIFLVLGGRAEVVVAEQVSELRRGDIIYLPPFNMHAIRNSSDEPFDIVSIYWENIAAAATALAKSGPQTCWPDRTLVFCPPITPNGGLHLGHLSGPYLRADLFARALRSTGRDALVITGTDDHQSFVATRAHSQGMRPESVAGTSGDQITSTLAAINVDTACLYRPLRDDQLTTEIRQLFEVLANSPAVSLAVVETPWCGNCAQSLYQSFAHGRCPHCGESSDGEICEACGRPNRAGELLDLACAQCGGVPTLRPEPTLHLNLDKFAEPLARYLGGAYGGGQSRHLADELLRGGLGDYRLTRHSRWGLGVSGPEPDEQVIDPWVELALTQILNDGRFAGNGRTANVTVLGFDNTYFYVVLLPVICFALGLESALPQGFISNRFLHLENSKFSTSRRHVVWADDVLDDVPVDFVRAALLRRSPEEEVRSVSQAEIGRFGADPLVDKLDQWLVTLRELPGDGEVPGTGAWTVNHRSFYRALCMLSEEFDHLLAVDSFSSVAYIEKLESLLRDAARFHAVEQARRKISAAQEEARTSVALEYLAVKAFAALVCPVMPTVGSILWQELGLSGDPRRERHWSFIPSGTRTHFTGPTVVETVRGGHLASRQSRE